MKRRKRHDPLLDEWWVAYEHPAYGTCHVLLRWHRVARDLYAARVAAVEFDLFTPGEEQDRIVDEIRRFRVTSMGDGAKATA